MISEHEWPNGAVTFLFSDIEDSTALWDRHRSAMRAALAEHDRLLQTAVESNGGVLVKNTGDGIMAAFTSPSAALAAALDGQRALEDSAWPAIAPDKIRVRMGLHTGEAELRAGDYYGTDVNRAARLMGIGHGRQILLSNVTANLIRGGLPHGTRLRDLGRHHLKGLSRPAHVFQIEMPGLPHDFPPLRTGETAKGNLPQPLTDFIGRQQELARIEQLLGETRLLTLIGPGGTGKTRLSLEAGRRVEGLYDHGVWLIELAPLTDGELIPATIAALFELREQPGAAITDTLTDYLRGKRLLLILDNCEHLVAACARLSAQLLPAAPELTILASSREGLGVPGETTVHIPAMAVPGKDIAGGDDLAQFEAVRLFLARARTANPTFELTSGNAEAVSQIVRRLDGIPLAIELAAARMKLLSPAQIAARLDDRFRLLTGGSRTALPRQQTLRALIDWSYDLLDEEARWFMRQMAVFAGGWTLEAAEYVVESATVEQRFLDALDLLADLLNKSLVQNDDASEEMRYHYLETIRQYARDRLFEAGEGPTARDRHFQYFLKLTENNFNGIMESFRNLAQIDQLTFNLDNLRAALDWGTASHPMEAIYLLRYLAPLWSTLGLNLEAQRRAQLLLQALAELPAADGEAARARRRARAYGLTVFALGSGAIGGAEGGYAAAVEAVALFREDGSVPEALADALFWQSILGIEIGRPSELEAARECYEIGRQLQNRIMQHVGLMAMARWELVKGETTAAAGHLAKARQMQTKVGIPTLIAYQAYAEALLARETGDFEAARRALAEGGEAMHQMHHRVFASILESELGHTLRQSGDLGSAESIYRQTIREWQDLGHRAAVANQLECFAFIAVHEARYDRAAQLFGAAEAMRSVLSSSMMPIEAREYDAHVSALREAVDSETLETAWQAGRQLDLEKAIDLALSEREPDEI